MNQQTLSDTAATPLRLDEQILQVEAGPSEKRGAAWFSLDVAAQRPEHEALQNLLRDGEKRRTA